MNAPAHTPGPWEAVKLEIPGHAFWIVLHRGGRLTEKGSEGEANAHLSAAAPEMYQALREVLLFFNDENCDDIVTLKIHGAIAKAEGRA